MCDFFLIVLIMLAGGVVGGSANWVVGGISPNVNETEPSTTVLQSHLRYGLIGYWILGIAAAAAVPLFLSLAQSELLKSVTLTNEKETLTFLGMCIVAAFSSKNFMVSISDKLISEVQDTKRGVKENKESISEIKENIPSATDHTKEEAHENFQPPPLSNDEIKILRSASYMTKRTLSGIANDALISIESAKPIFDDLIDKKKLIDRTTSSKTGTIRYSINSQGVATLKHYQGSN